MRKLRLFSGIGGIDLAAHWAGMETVAFCEREPFPQQVLRKHWPDVPIYDDVCTLTAERLQEDEIIGSGRAIDIISAGYPCQPFSNAGKRRGKEDDRHLWPEVARLLSEIRPRWFIGENVAGHVTMGLDDVLIDLESLGYKAQAFVIPAAAIGAPHRRDRVFVVAHSDCCDEWTGEEPKQPKRNAPRESISNSSDDVANSASIGKSGSREPFESIDQTSSRDGQASKSINVRFGEERSAESRMGRVLDGLSNRVDGHRWPATLGQPQHDWEPPRVATGVKDRTGRLKALGNAVNPYQVYPILAAIKLIHDEVRQ
ncbi:DNA (cytosine-5-)-methyltransferase [Paenibacillus sp. ACRRX]|uniref:DNA cytosine methyltransferase n=1 Tax=Paenibacillus sp. ACRRX TaxID=2918206 RepID=UPI001EF6ECB0|nr:DNA (cytosine-5-)-methyltransferase [Paenibacillus sp. ACRRX]MCG7406751.1 DNA (cytosine-5-)-methyltransferase [Paenibacillus sp. ACRRX]